MCTLLRCFGSHRSRLFLVMRARSQFLLHLTPARLARGVFPGGVARLLAQRVSSARSVVVGGWPCYGRAFAWSGRRARRWGCIGGGYAQRCVSCSERAWTVGYARGQRLAQRPCLAMRRPASAISTSLQASCCRMGVGGGSGARTSAPRSTTPCTAVWCGVMFLRLGRRRVRLGRLGAHTLESRW